jgi:hypothetical protein
MSYLQGCYIDAVGSPITSGYAEVQLMAGEGALYTLNGKEFAIGCQPPMRYGISGDGCWKTGNLINTELVSPPGSFYTINVFMGGKRCESWVVKTDGTTATSGTVDIKSIGQRINSPHNGV